MSEIENLALRVPYLFGKDYIGGYLGCNDEEHYEQYFRPLMPLPINECSRGVHNLVPLLVGTSKTMYTTAAYLPIYAVILLFGSLFFCECGDMKIVAKLNESMLDAGYFFAMITRNKPCEERKTRVSLYS